ncbi:glucosaminidase domain-containing protein [Aquimarina algicola]|uniref:Mannosyl-glycoprotein endo-beta-N-acetylglucosamidase-like domain-containing protein n=1 Tax=Aquimarina algicola TaxID=2589995 RepID=A0A504JD93_9FLAO|nr:glucosaminidase domain-containing protein [Aquimarina algicola]TPN88837.1 hypothetical protein FHK87_01085 [Aquimarina algicola]
MKASLLKFKLFLYIWVIKQLYSYNRVPTKTIYAQAWLETGGFTSAIFKENHNLFGMRQAKVRKNFATGTNRSHATYKNHLDSIRDYFERQKYFNIPDGTTSTYIDATVKSNYAEDSNYKQKWFNLSDTVKTPLGTKTLLGFFLFSSLC